MESDIYSPQYEHVIISTSFGEKVVTQSQELDYH